ncbi:MAG: hypothetical protein ACFE0Q_21515 [Anaerolineae bacterium]
MIITRKSMTTLFIMVLLLVPLLSSVSLQNTNAQEATEEPEITAEVTPTEAPTSAEETADASEPTPEVTEEVTVAVTDAPESTETVSESTETVSEATSEVTAEVTEPTETMNISDAFTELNAELWSLVGWSVNEGTLRTDQTASSARILGFEPTHFELNVQVLIAEDNVLVIAFRADESQYRVMLSSNGSSRLYRDDVLLDAYASDAPTNAWVDLQLLVANDTIAVTTNQITGIVYTDTPSLATGAIELLTEGTVSGEIQVDNLTISTVDETTVIFPGAYEQTPLPEVTEEAEITPEVTEEAEVTPEVTAEAEVTPEVTEEAESVSNPLYDKTPENIHNILDLYLAEADLPLARLLLEYEGYLIDVEGSVGIKILPTENITPAQIERLVIDLGGRPTVVAQQSVTAFMPIDSLLLLLESEQVASIVRPDVARSTGNAPAPNAAPATDTYTEGFDMIGVTDWHNAGFTGQGVRVGIIDSGYNTISAGDPEYACLSGPIEVGVPNNHGLAMIQLICDMAPDADVFVYEVNTSPYEDLANAVYNAIADNIDVLVITLNMTGLAPGDGTGLEDGDDPYVALNAAREQGMVIFSAAGNFGETYGSGTVNRTERFAVIEVPSTTPGQVVAEFEIKLTAGDEIVVTWDDWIDRGGLGLSDPDNIEDFDVEVRLDPAGRYDEDDYRADDDYSATAFGTEFASRGTIFDNPTITYTVSPTFDRGGPAVGVNQGCPVLDSDGSTYDGECSVIVTITREQGDSPVTMQVGVIPIDTPAVNPEDPRDDQLNFNFVEERFTEDIRITNFIASNGTTLVTTHNGTIARPADSPDVITVGAVCANENANFALSPSSSQGPIFNAFGEANPSTAPTRFSDTKPEILSPAYVTTTFNPVTSPQNCDGTIAGIDNTGGFGGTSAAAGHAGAMTTVLLSNPTYRTLLNSQGVDVIKHYIMNHAVELPLGSQADGLDYIHGAGFFTLGSPFYNPVNTSNPATPADLISDNNCVADGILYVGQGNPDSIQDGSFANPYSNINTAIGNAVGAECIVVMPGEYVTPIVVDNPDIRIYGLNQVDTNDYSASIIYVSGQYANGTQTVDGRLFNDNAGIYIDATSGTRLDGLHFIHSNTLEGLSRQAVFFNNATNTTFANNVVGAVTVDGVSYTGWTNGDETPLTVYQGNSVTISNNIFNGNVGEVPSPTTQESAAINILDAGTASPNAILIRNNTFENNSAPAGNNSTLIYSANSYTDVVGNEFVGNTLSTVIASRGNSTRLNITSNVFLNNDAGVSGTSNPSITLVHSYDTPATFANNTVVRNILTGSNNAAILGLETDGTQFDFANNLIYQNTWPTVVRAVSPIPAICDAFISNWWDDAATADCFDTAINDNIIGGMPEFVGNRPGSTLDPLTDPQFYALAVVDNDAGIYSQGMDYSDEIVLASGIDLNAAPFNIDADGEDRVTDIVGWERNVGNLLIESGSDLDIGAYEFKQLTLPDADPYSYENLSYTAELTFLENQGIIVIDLGLRVSGGLGNITYSLITRPDNYGTSCGPQFTTSNQGIFFGTGTNASRIFYCPPNNFYTGHNNPDVVVTDLSFTYQVEDEGGQSESEDVTFIIEPVNDALLDAVTDGVQFTYVGNIGQEGVELQLRPFVRYNNFSFSEANNPNFFINGVAAADYPFSYTYNGYQGDDIFATGPTLNGDIITFDLDAVEGVAIIEYTATDARGGTLTGSITVSNVSRVPSEAGIYDDSSFAFDYTGNWAPIADNTAFNNTLHTSNTAGDVASFGIRGAGFTLYMNNDRRGGLWDLEIDINASDNYQTLTGWSLISDSNSVYEASITQGNVTVTCTTTSIFTNTATPPTLTSRNALDYTVKCDAYDDTDEPASGVHLVNVINTSGSELSVDAFSLTDSNNNTDMPLGPGVHDVDELVARDAFGNSWSESIFRTYTSQIAYQLTGPVSAPSANNTVSFLINGGSGFAIGTTIERTPIDYTICVTNIDTNAMTCQDYDYSVNPVITRPATQVYRPFYGLNPDITYRVEILPTSVADATSFIIDSVVVYEPVDTTTELLSGATDDVDLDKILYGSFTVDGWDLNTLSRTANEATLTSVSRRVRTPGPYVAFQTPATVDTIYWTFEARGATRQAMVCVDRGQGIATSNGDIVNLADVNIAHGNCLVIDLFTGEYMQIEADGSTTSGTDNIRIVDNTVVIAENTFRTNWDDSNSIHTVEIFSLYDASLSVDQITAIGDTEPLRVGRYEEYTTSITYYDAALNPVEPEVNDSPRTIDYTGTFTQVFGRTVRDFGGGVMFTNDVGATISFEFTGTGFAPAFRLANSAEEVQICWIAGSESVQNTMDNGDCVRFDNENRVTTYNALRPIMGLAQGTYTVAIRFEGDNYLPTANRAAEPEMWFDGVFIYDDDLTALTALTVGTTYQGNYDQRLERNTFAYFGEGWEHLTGPRGRLYNNSDVDNIRRGEAGATVAFRVNNANVIRLSQPLGRNNTPLLVCADDDTDRYCQTIDVTGIGNDATFSISLSEDRQPGDYTVTISALNGGALFFDAVTPELITQPLTEGTYDNSDPNISYTYNWRNLMPNGGFERTPSGEWLAINGATLLQARGGYSGLNRLQVSGTNAGVESPTVELLAGQTYTVLAYVQVDRITGGEVTIDVNGEIATTDANRIGTFEPFRFDITPVSDITLSLTFTGDSDTTFSIDEVQVIEGGQWLASNSRTAYQGYTAVSTVPGSQFSFSFTGTGFALGAPVSSTGGAMQVCYDGPVTDCITYDQESRRADNNNLRVIEGLPSGTYDVVVRDVEDGNSTTLPTNFPNTRNSRFAVGQLELDYITIFNTEVETIAESGNYNESDGNANGRYLSLIPSDRWSTITGPAARLYSEESYVAAVDSLGRPDRFASGPTAMIGLDLSTYSASVLIDIRAANRLASDQLLACIGGPDGEVVRVPYNAAERNLNEFELQNSDNCALLSDLQTSAIIALTPDNLPALGVTGSEQVLTLQTLTSGSFVIDGYQVLYGDQLTSGYYEETILDYSGDWSLSTNVRYSGGSALTLFNNDGTKPQATLNFAFYGTGITVLTADSVRGGEIEMTVTNGGTINEVITRDTTGAVAYGVGLTVAGLPEDTYTVSITADADQLETVVVDAIQIYGELPSLGSLYDDAQVDANNNSLIAYGPGPDAWAILEGRFASNALNQTLHATTQYGAVASFEIGETVESDGIVIYYDTVQTRVPSVRVCFRDVATGALAGDCIDQALDNSGRVDVVPNIPTVNKNYFVTIENRDTRLRFALDAIQVLEDGLSEGIYTATTLHNNDAGDTSTLNTTVNAVELAPGQNLILDVIGVAFSFDVTTVGGTTREYSLCITDTVDCDVTDTTGQLPAGNSALTYTGMQDSSGAERELTVTLTNDGDTTLRVNELHVLGDDDTLTINDSSRYENDAPQIRYLPFGSYTESALPRSQQSGGSEHVSNTIGAMVYFEIETTDPTAAGFEIARQLSTRNGSSEVCYGQIGDGVSILFTLSLADARGTADQCETIEHNTSNAYQATSAIATGTTCANGCWVSIQNLDVQTSPFDFVRLYDTGVAMQAGQYEESYPGLNFVDGVGGIWDVEASTDRFASGGFVRQATITDEIDAENGAVMWFQMQGTGFGVNFLVDANADAVEICYQSGEQTPDNVLANGICQTYENEERRPQIATRNIVGLPADTYTVAVRMLPDNNLPRPHSPLRPITMRIDGVQVYDTDLTMLNALGTDTRYETSYVNRDVTNDFTFYGNTWTSLEGARARNNSALNYDQAREYGATVLFRTQNADSMTLYSNLSRANSDIRVCVVPVDITASTLTDADSARCFDSSLDGRGFSQPLGFRFRDILETPADYYTVSITALNSGIFPIDAIELSATTPLTEGYYEATDVNLYYDSNAINHIVNSSMETDSDWLELLQPTITHSARSRFAGRFGYNVIGNRRGNGLGSQLFDLEGATIDEPISYTAIARVRVASGSVRMELVQETSPLSISEFRPFIPTAQSNPREWQTLRAEFTLTQDYQDLQLQIVANSGNTEFDVDEVYLFEDGNWVSTFSPRSADNNVMEGITAGASLQFAFEGTGFEIGTVYSIAGGEVEICYDSDDAIFDQANDDTEHCFTYQNENRRASYDVSRTIAGLPFGTYNVRVRNVDDGYSVNGRTLNAARNIRFADAALSVDWVRIFNNSNVPSIASGFFNEDATDENGNPYLVVEPTNGWSSVEGRLARNYTEESYLIAVDRNGRNNRFASGPNAQLSVDVTDAGTTVILYTGPTPNFNSTQMLVCAGTERSGEIVQVEVPFGVRTRLDFALESPETPGDCVLRDGKASGAIVVGPDDLTALGVAGNDVPVTFTPLEPGQFSIDGYQVIAGTTLTPGVYDEFLPDSLLNFDSSASDLPSDDTTPRCDSSNFWCRSKLRTAYGGEIIRTQNTGATLTFDIRGTGFSVLTEVGTTGAEMRICYAQKPVNDEVSFPSRADTLNNGSFSWDNTTQDIAVDGIWCDYQTTNTNRLLWDQIQPDRVNPSRGNQYGFAYYGLPYGEYTVEVMMFEEPALRSRNTIGIDGIVVFDNYDNLPVMGTANSLPAQNPDVVLMRDGFFDNANAPISLEPSINWQNSDTARFGPPRGPFALTESSASNAGSIAQMLVDGNAVTLFHTQFARNTRDTRVCVVVTGAVIHCTQEASSSAAEIENPTSNAPWALAVETASFSQSGRGRTYFTPIMVYGLGNNSSPDLPHIIIMENRDHGRALTIDAVQVRD